MKLAAFVALAFCASACKDREPIHDPNAPSCDTLRNGYATALRAAKRCRKDSDCTTRIDDRLGCACTTFAVAARLHELERLRADWDRALCGHSVGCVPAPCPEPISAECGANGECVDRLSR